MGEPALNYDEDQPQDPYAPKPHLGVIDGDGESTPRSKDHLKAVGSDGLRAGEEAGAKPDTKVDDDKEKRLTGEDGGGLFRGGSRGRRLLGRLSRNQKIAGGGIAAIIIGGGFGIFTLVSGPLKFIHAAQLLQQFHFGEQEDFFEDRTSKLYRYFKWKDQPQNRRLSTVGNKLANKLDTKFKSVGMELEFGSRGSLQKVIIDPAKFPADDLERIRADFGDSVTDRVGPNHRVEIDIQNKLTTVGKEKRLFRGVRKSIGSSGAVASIQGWLFGKRLGLTRHPIRKLDTRALEAFDAWRVRKNGIIQNGDTDALAARGTQSDADDPDRPPPENDGQKAANDLTDSATPDGPLDPLDPNANVEATRKKISGKLKAAGAVTALTGITCLVQGVAKGAGDVEYQEVFTESVRHAGYIASLGGQGMYGFPDLVQLAFESNSFQDPSDDDNEGTRPNNFFEAASWQSELGNSGQGLEYADSAKIGGATNLLTRMSSNLPGFASWTLGVGCDFLASLPGQVISFGVDLALGPVSAAGGLAVSLAASPYMNDLARFVARDLIPGQPVGALLGHVSNQGGYFLASQQFLTMGATQLNDGERAQLKQAQIDRVLAENSEKSWATRYLSVMNPNSVVSKAIDSSPTPSQALSNIASTPSSVFKNVSSMFTPRASAASAPYDYGVPKYAFRPSEVNLVNNDESYANPYENANRITGNLPALHNEFSEKCFGVKFTLNSDGEETGFQMTTPVDLREDKYPSDCKRTDEAFTRYRLYINDLMTFETHNCYEGDEESCAMLGYGTAGSPQDATGSAIVGDPYTDSTSVPCASGTEDIGIHDGYVDGTLVKMRICKLPNLPSSGEADVPGGPHTIPGGEGFAKVNSRVSGAWLALVNEASANGISLNSLSSFITKTHQESICAESDFCRNGDYTFTDRPGTSPHQAGVAIDFDNGMWGVTGGVTCDTRATAPGSKAWTWLRDNAPRYGFKQYAPEAWHWDARPTGCGGS